MLVVELNSDIGINELRFAIIKQACVDYDEALKYLRGRKPSDSSRYLLMLRQKGECEAFFKSDYFGTLCALDGETIMKTIRYKYYNRPIRWGTD